MNAFMRFLGMTRKPKRRKNLAEKPRLGRVTTRRYNGVTHFSVKLNVPKPRKK